MPDVIVARVLRLPGCEVSRWEADEPTATLTLWVRRHGEAYACGGCGRWRRDVHSGRERRVRDLPWGTWAVWLVVDVHRVRCRRCGVRTERIPWLAGKAHYTARFEAAVAAECEQAPVSRVAARWGLAPETVRQLDKRVLRRWAARRPRTPLRYLGVDELFVGREVQFLTVVSDLESGEPIWILMDMATRQRPEGHEHVFQGADGQDPPAEGGSVVLSLCQPGPPRAHRGRANRGRVPSSPRHRIRRSRAGLRARSISAITWAPRSRMTEAISSVSSTTMVAAIDP